MAAERIDVLAALWDLRDARAAVAELIEALKGYEAVRDDLFAHCLSNGIFNAWGKPMNCTLLNEAHLAATSALARMGEGA